MHIGEGLTLLLGGARSGKSDLSVKLGQSWSESAASKRTVLFVATAEPLDADMTARIDRHRLDRPTEWETIEQSCFGADDLAELSSEPLLILDCLTLLVSNLLFAEKPIDQHIAALSKALAQRAGPSIVVSNEVGMGIHPETALGRSYRDQLGTANRVMAEAATTALLIVAGRALPLEPVSWSFEPLRTQGTQNAQDTQS
ncbi:MAG: bifunctional adenosylcobinamide kinase/adenosylcobinamide-phosphate guanylyltransferase [Acidimicrobiales bacterium]